MVRVLNLFQVDYCARIRRCHCVPTLFFCRVFSVHSSTFNTKRKVLFAGSPQQVASSKMARRPLKGTWEHSEAHAVSLNQAPQCPSMHGCIRSQIMRPAEQPEHRVQQEDDNDGAVTAATAAFKNTAAKQLKGLMAHGINPGDASTELLDELTQHKAGMSMGTTMSSPHLQHVVALTGCSHAIAMRTLLLKDEIAHLR